MTDTEMKIMQTFERVLPKLTEKQQDKLLDFGEGMAFMAEKQERERQTA